MPDQPGSYATADGAALYEACRSADTRVQADAYERLWGYLYRVALQVVRDQREAEALAEDCAQVALIRVHERLAEIREPAAFLGWARRIASHAAIDELRRRRSLVPLVEDEPETGSPSLPESSEPAPEEVVLEEVVQSELRGILGRAPMSDRSRRVVVGRYLDGLPDEQLCEAETDLAGQPVLPSHIQVTRAKDILRLRGYGPLQVFLGRMDEE